MNNLVKKYFPPSSSVFTNFFIYAALIWIFNYLFTGILVPMGTIIYQSVMFCILFPILNALVKFLIERYKTKQT